MKDSIIKWLQGGEILEDENRLANPKISDGKQE